MRRVSREESSTRPHEKTRADPAEVLSQLGYSRVSGEAEEEGEIATIVTLSNDSRPFAKVEVLGISMIGLLDSGAARTVLGIGGKRLVEALKLKLKPTETSLRTAAGQELEVLGCIEVPITFNGETKLLPVLVAPQLKRRCILGYDFWRKFGIRPSIQQCIETIDGNLEGLEELLTEDQIQQ